jgi:hypothetical protein
LPFVFRPAIALYASDKRRQALETGPRWIKPICPQPFKGGLFVFSGPHAHSAAAGRLCNVTISPGPVFGCGLVRERDTSHFKAVMAAPFVRKVEAASIVEIDRLMAELQELKNHLQSERKRIERETVRYRNLTKTASASVNTIFDAVSQLYPTLYRPKSSASEVTAASRDATIGAPRNGHQHHRLPDTSEYGPVDAINGTRSLKSLSS